MSRDVVILRRSGTRLECTDEHTNLLTLLEANNLCVEFQCREGYCGSCRMRLLKGEVHYHNGRWLLCSKMRFCPAAAKPKARLSWSYN
jgi:ferredoxin